MSNLSAVLTRLREAEAEDQRIHDAMLDTATPTERDLLSKPRDLRDHTFLPLIECAEALQEIARHEDVGYGFFTGGDPRKFSPDGENEPSEIAAHKEACRLWAEAEASGHAAPTSEPAGKWLHDAESKTSLHVLRSGFGPGSYSRPTEAAEIAAAALSALEQSAQENSK